MNTHETLKAARELIAEPDAWTQGHSAQRADGTPVLPEDEKAVRWCASGAISRVGINEGRAGSLSIECLANAMGGIPVSVFNDNHTHAEVLTVFDKAIEATA